MLPTTLRFRTATEFPVGFSGSGEPISICVVTGDEAAVPVKATGQNQLKGHAVMVTELTLTKSINIIRSKW